MTDDLSTKLAVLTEARPEPADPAAPIRLRIKSRRRRRRGYAVVVATAAATAAVLAAGPILGSFRSAGNEPGVAGFGASVPLQTPSQPPVGATPSTAPVTQPSPSATGDHKTVMPAPWSDDVFSKNPDSEAYPPRAYYIAKGTIPTETWAVIAFSNWGCMVTDEGPATSFGRPFVCFNDWKPGQRVSSHVVQGYAKEKNAGKIDQTLVIGAVSADARKVVIKAAGTTYTADAVGTPATDRLRFFALVIPRKDVKITQATPLDATGKLADAPTGIPTGQFCDPNCGVATPAK